MRCPRCQSTITATPDPEGFLTCPGCRARLRSRAATATVRALDARGTLPDGANPSSTLPPGTPLPRIPAPGTPEAAAALAEDGRAPAPFRAAPAVVAAPGSRPVAAAATATPGPAAPAPRSDDEAGRVMRVQAPREVSRAADDTARSVARHAATLESLMDEVKALRAIQEEILTLLKQQAQTPPAGRNIDFADELGLPVPPVVRKRQRKSVLLIDDDPESRTAAVSAFEAADIPTRAFAEGRTALTAIAEEKPDVIVMELDIGGPMAGKDVINLIKATMEWVDIPILLYTRAPITSQREARTVHGADDFVSKQDGPQPLLARVVIQFRRG